MMPLAAIWICLYVSRAMGLDQVIDEMTSYGGRFHRKGIFTFMIRHVCIILLLIILISSVAQVLGLITI
jgi:NSS family neurotransmitter:Na+ symporter